MARGPSPRFWSISTSLSCRARRRIWTALENVRAGNPWRETLPNQGKTIEEVVASTWKPKEVAPANATPYIGGPLAVWVSSLRSLGAVVHDLAVELEGVKLDELVFPHFLCGPLDARQRLEFYGSTSTGTWCKSRASVQRLFPEAIRYFPLTLAPFRRECSPTVPLFNPQAEQEKDGKYFQECDAGIDPEPHMRFEVNWATDSGSEAALTQTSQLNVTRVR